MKVQEDLNIIITGTLALSWVNFKLRSDGILVFELMPDHVVSMRDVKESEEAIEKIGRGKAFPNLILAGRFTSLEDGVREYMASEYANRFTLADAFVLRSLTQKILMNLYLKFDKPARPTAAFNREEDAVTWLKRFL